MRYNMEYLAGLDIAEKDGKVRLLRVPFIDVHTDLEGRSNSVLLALQNQGYEVLGATPAFGTLSAAAQGLWITYR